MTIFGVDHKGDAAVLGHAGIGRRAGGRFHWSAYSSWWTSIQSVKQIVTWLLDWRGEVVSKISGMAITLLANAIVGVVNGIGPKGRE